MPERDCMDEHVKKALQLLLLYSPDVYVCMAYAGKDGVWVREVIHAVNELNDRIGTLEELTAGSLLSELSRVNGGPVACWRHRMETNAPADSLAVGDDEEGED